MRAFNCDQCGHLVFFDSVRCVHCGSTLAFIPEWMRIASLTPLTASRAPIPNDVDETPSSGSAWSGLWVAREESGLATSQWRLCANHVTHQACNFAVSAADPCTLCISCRQTRWLPDLSHPDNLRRWKRTEDAKRRLFYTLRKLGLTTLDGFPAPEFEFLADMPGQPPVMTGHRSGTIILNVSEADDDERARRRIALYEPYRTLIGHLRHESGHFFWDVLIRDTPALLEKFRQIFGDERQDYQQSIDAYYTQAPTGPLGWQEHFVSAYATAHPWEDWAETWAHYLHMVDVMETAACYQTTMNVPGEPAIHAMQDPYSVAGDDFDSMLRAWVPLTLLLNSLNSSLGQEDAYPFALSSGSVAKLRFVHELLRHRRSEPRPMPTDKS